MRAASRLRLWQQTGKSGDSWDHCLEISWDTDWNSHNTPTLHCQAICCTGSYCNAEDEHLNSDSWVGPFQGPYNEKHMHMSVILCWAATGSQVSYLRRCTAFSCSQGTSSVVSRQTYNHVPLRWSPGSRMAHLQYSAIQSTAPECNYNKWAEVPPQSAHHRRLT